jgi:hypothetical protein
MTIFKLGVDPEIFIKRQGGGHVSAHDIVPGSKSSQFKVPNGVVQPDGLAAEFGIDPVPHTDFEAFNDNIVSVMTSLRDIIKAYDPSLGFDLSPSVAFDKSYYDALPESAKELGCDPDFCAYSVDALEPNVKPDGAAGVRSAAGHIHIGWGDGIPWDNPEHLEICRSFVRNLDVFVGLAMLLIDADDRRRELYGKAGAFRPKPYGVEYRTPSNVWLRSKTARRFIHGQVSRAITDMQTGAPAFEKLARDGYDVQSIINAGDRPTAKRLLNDYFYVRVPAGLEVA